jgi:hypothetical protein
MNEKITLKIIASLLEDIISGEHYKTKNLYTRPVKEALKFLAELQNKKDWFEADFKQYLEKEN